MRLWKFGRRSAEPSAAPAPAKTRPLTSLRRTAVRMFKAAATASHDRWDSSPVAPDEYITRQQRTLVAASRSQWANNDYVKNFIRLARQNVVGPQGIILQAQVRKARGNRLDTETNDAIEAAFIEWGKAGNCDVTGKLSLWKIQRLVLNTTARDGEFLIRIVTGRDAGPWGFALQLIDPQRMPPDYNVDRLTGGGFIRHGIEFNRYGRAVAYHITSADEYDAEYYALAGRGYVRVPADEIIHGFLEELVGQRRGLPWASTGLFRLRHLAGFEDAAVQNARASASKMGFVQYEDGYGPDCDDDEGVEIEAEPLSFHELPAGARIAEWDPQYPNGEFAVFNKAMLRGAAAGMGVLYNNLAGDLEGVNFSSIRQGTLDERDHWKELQQWLIETLMQPIYEAWLPRALLAGRIKIGNRPLGANRLEAARHVVWQGRRWQWIDPRADVDAAVNAMSHMLTTPSQIIREAGRDPNAVFDEWADDCRTMKESLISQGFSDEQATHMVMLMVSPGRLPIKSTPTDVAPAGNAED